MSSATFYFDLGSPYAYLAAERVGALLGEGVEWQPILLGGVFRHTGRSSWAVGDAGRRAEGMAEVERRAEEYGLPRVVWPDPWPGDYLFAMRAATYASTLGRGRELALQAFRDAFQGGGDLSAPANVLAAAERAGLSGAAVQAGAGEQSVKLRLREATGAAARAGVFGVPTVAVAGELFWGDDRLEQAAGRLAGG